MRQYFHTPAERYWYIGLVVAVALNIALMVYTVTPPEPPPFELQQIKAVQHFLNSEGYPCVVDGKLTVKGDGETEGAWNDYNRDHNRR